jgi:Mg2+ and Co2+ transporter CorA
LRSEREERLKNTNDILRLDRQLNVNNGQPCLETRVSKMADRMEERVNEIADKVEEIDDRLLVMDTRISTMRYVGSIIGVLFTSVVSILSINRK